MTVSNDSNVINLTAADGSNAPLEGATAQIAGILYDEAGDALVKADITAFTLTLVDESTSTAINSRSDQDILDTNGGTLTDVASAVNYTIVLSAADNALVGTATEAHIAHLKWTWSGGTGRQELRFTVVKDKI